MKKTMFKLVSLMLVCCLLFSLTACFEKTSSNTGIAKLPESVVGGENIFLNNNTESENTQQTPTNMLNTSPKSEYNKGVVLVKFEDVFNSSAFGELKYLSAEPLYKNSKWYQVVLVDSDKTEDAVKYLTELGNFEKVDYDYIMGVTGPKEDAEKNPNYDNQVNLGLSNIPNGWTHNGKAPGGSPDVVVAVIDTGVDYNHLDLRNNIWVNTAEIPGNGKDDDGNGYVDDINGWDCVGDDNDPMDDNGHGTHVAGIIAAENNKEGGIGVAYNCKVMVIKAGNSSGYFNNSDIAEAIQYAYMNGADVINMSFGGSNISIAVEEALENAYNTTVLVAAAGNDGACNNLFCQTCDIVKVSYPAALPYVIGVMSTDKDGKHISSFSNYDHNPYDTIEYEVYAVGEGVGSTWPSNKYACLNGTSMAAPTVAGIAALLRSYYSDREVYSTKFIQSQIVNTGTVNPHRIVGKDHVTDEAHSVADVVEALTKLPKPNVNLYDYYIDDSTSISKNNNGNGVVDAGETVRLYISLHNRGGVATNVNVSIDTYRSEIGNESLTDPYFTLVNTTMQLSDIGTYSVRESGDKYFEIIVDEKCPNDYLVSFNIRFTYKNGLDENDKVNYSGDGSAKFNVSRGFYLTGVITENTVFEADKLYIIAGVLVIPKNVTVTFAAGCEIQFYDDQEYYNSPQITVLGTLNILGTKENMVVMRPCERYTNYAFGIINEGTTILEYVDAINLVAGNKFHKYDAFIKVSNSVLRNNVDARGMLYRYKNGELTSSNLFSDIDGIGNINVISHAEFSNNYIELTAYNLYITSSIFNNNILVVDTKNCLKFIMVPYANPTYYLEFKNNVILTVNNGYNYSPATLEIKRATVENNLFISCDESLASLLSITLTDCITSNNSFSTGYQKNADQVFSNYYDENGYPTIDVYGSLSDSSVLWPYVVSTEMFDSKGNPTNTVGKEEIKVRVTFNRPMDTTKDTYLTFGTVTPYADYKITGEWISDTVWEGTYTLKAQIENGQNFLKVNNACAAEDQTKTVFGEYQLHEFTIDTTEAMSMNLIANPLDEGIELTFAQDDYDTLLGYNIYRSTDKDGNFVKLNPTILLPEENTFLDENAEPGKTYWYTYTVVLSDFTESKPAGKVVATSFDTMSPSLYHTPVNQGYENNNLVISATATDNVAISNVTLYYRVKGQTEWKSLTMSKQNDKFSAKIMGSEVTLDGIEYYIVATDGVNTVQKGSAEAPYTVVVKSADSLLGKGDVDGNGQVTTKDALMIMQAINGDLILSDDQFKRANLNNDNVLSSVEALRILQYVNGKVTTLEM